MWLMASVGLFVCLCYFYASLCMSVRVSVCMCVSVQFELVYFDNIWLARVQQYRWLVTHHVTLTYFSCFFTSSRIFLLLLPPLFP